MYKDYLQIYKFSYLQYVQVEAPGRLIYFLQFCLRNLVVSSLSLGMALLMIGNGRLCTTIYMGAMYNI